MKYILLAAAAALVCGPAMAKVTFQTIDDPADPTFNQLLGINSAGTISGYYGSGDAGHPNKGYTTVPPYTAFTNQNFPKSAQTQVTGINSANSVVTVGFYSLTNLGGGQDANTGYVYASGKFKAVADPLVTSSPAINQLLGIDTVGDAVGFYNDASGNSHAYTYNISTKRFTPITVNSKTTVVSAAATGINSKGVICGFYVDTSGNTQGYVQDLNGKGAQHWSGPGAKMTQFLGINTSKFAVGFYVDAAGLTHGVKYSVATRLGETIDVPGASGGTVLNGIDDAGDIVGFYVDAAGNTHGVLIQGS